MAELGFWIYAYERDLLAYCGAHGQPPTTLQETLVQALRTYVTRPVGQLLPAPPRRRHPDETTVRIGLRVRDPTLLKALHDRARAERVSVLTVVRAAIRDYLSWNATCQTVVEHVRKRPGAAVWPQELLLVLASVLTWSDRRVADLALAAAAAFVESARGARESRSLVFDVIELIATIRNVPPLFLDLDEIGRLGGLLAEVWQTAAGREELRHILKGLAALQVNVDLSKTVFAFSASLQRLMGRSFVQRAIADIRKHLHAVAGRPAR